MSKENVKTVFHLFSSLILFLCYHISTLKKKSFSSLTHLTSYPQTIHISLNLSQGFCDGIFPSCCLNTIEKFKDLMM